MADLNELGLTPDEEVPSAPLEDLPESRPPIKMFQPGWYTFQFPDEFVFGKVDRNGKDYLSVNFLGKENGKPLRTADGNVYFTSFNNAPYTIYDFGRNFESNDLALLLKALGHKEIPTTHQGYADALELYAGKTFRAEQKLTASAKMDRNGFEAKFASFVNQINTKNQLDEGTAYTAKSGKVTLPIPTDEDGNLVDVIQAEDPNTEETVELRVFGNLSGFSRG